VIIAQGADEGKLCVVDGLLPTRIDIAQQSNDRVGKRTGH
jgi:hypothetical protein